jgi:VanZ family protein
MRLLFSILSIAYIAGIFLFADSSVVSTLAPFNPYSLLHIPLYGILMVLLLFSFIPINQLSNNLVTNKLIPPSTHSRTNSFTHPSINASTHFLLPGFIALVVAIADEIHQAYVPGRDASVTDVLLDLFGIIFVLFLAFRLFKTQTNALTH